jgi:hypothetical protein
VRATARRSQLTNAWRARLGASANHSARRGSIRYRQAAAVAAHAESRIALTQKKRVGSSPEIHPATRMKYIVSTGYSSQLLFEGAHASR